MPNHQLCSFSEEKETHQLFSQTVQLEDGKIQKIQNGELQISATKLIRKIYHPL
jgi:anti-sigma28 factor (negative regulator of flagellin synthesis)